MRAPKLTVPGPGNVLVRALFLAVVIGGVIAMHILGHLTSHDDDVGMAAPAGVAVSAMSDSLVAGAGGAAVALREGTGPVITDSPIAAQCHGEHEPGCPERGFDLTSVCVAVLTAAVSLLGGLLRPQVTDWAAFPWTPSSMTLATVGSGLPPPRTPSLAQLSVLRI